MSPRADTCAGRRGRRRAPRGPRARARAGGYAVSAAENGLAGIVCLLFGARPDAVVLDLLMPVMSGADFIEVLRMEPSLAALPVVVVTGAPVPAEVTRAADAVLAKPFDIHTLATAIEALVSGRGRTPPGEASPPGRAGL